MKLQQTKADKFSTGTLPAMSFLTFPIIAAAREKNAFMSRRDSEREVHEMAGKTIIRSIFIISVLLLYTALMPTTGFAQFQILRTVNTTSDTVVAGACANGTAGCSLRGAMQLAATGGNLIQFAIPASDPFCSAGVCTINLFSALPNLSGDNVTISGPGADRLIVKAATGVNLRIFTVTATGTVRIFNITISDGSDTSNGAGIFSSGGGTVNINNCEVINNHTLQGGGIANSSGTMNISNSTISGNNASFGGGIANSAGGGVAIMNVTNSTISGNTANSTGGGVYNVGNAATLNITNSTISDNTANNGGGGIFKESGTINVKSSIIALNTSNQPSPDVNGAFVTAGFNLIGKRDGSTGFTAPTDMTGTIAAQLNPGLDPFGLQNNGGRTKTIALLPGSPAIDKATSSGLTGNLTTDQRGVAFPRTFDSSAIPNATGANGTDIGAFELQNKSPADFDGDNKTDISIFRPAPGEWWYLKSLNGGNAAAQFGVSTDKLTPGDFTGDGKTDIAFFRPSTGFWFVLRSEDFSFFSFPFGTSTDIPTVGDFDGDGRADVAVFRPSETNWYIRRSSDSGTTIQQFGANGDAPVPADYDGDGKSDIAIYRPSNGQWWINRSSNGSTFAVTFGNSADKAVQGDYTGDGKADVAFWRPSTGEWFVLRSEDSSFFSFPFGTMNDVPAPGDYDGDGKFDASVFRPSNNTWFIQRTTAGTLIQGFGIGGDIPVPSAFVP